MSNKYPGGLITSGASVGSSVAFDGSNDYLQVGSNAAFNFSASDCTIECWFFAATTPGSETEIVEFGTGSTNGDIQLIWDSGGQFTFGGSGQTKNRYTFPSGRWYYLAGVKSGSNWYLYIDGVQYVTQTSGTASSSNYVNIGSRNAGGNWITGNIYNLRISNVARYSGATAAMANVLTTDANTKLLTCVGRTITDLSGNNFAITVGGNAYMSSYGPPGYTAYNPALGSATPGIWTVSDAIQAAATRRWNMYDPYFNLTTLLLHGNGTNGAQNNTFLDSSSNNFTITRNGNTTQGTFSPFSQTGWSVYFTGAQTSPSLSFPTNAAYSLGSTSDFTVECWVYYTGGIGSETSLIERFDGTSGPGWILGKSSGDKFWFSFSGTPYPGNTTVVANQWYHVCWMRTGGNSYLFVNGVLDRTPVATSNFTDGTTPLSLGERDSGAQTFPFTGYMSNARIVKGTAVYSIAGFTPPTAPLTPITNTTFLSCQSSRFIDNSVTAATATVGAASSIQAYSPFLTNIAYTPTNQGGSGYFDGSGDYLAATITAIGTSQFTYEAFVYPTTLTGYQTLFDSRSSNTDTTGFTLQITPTGTIEFASNGGIATTATITAGQWSHICVTRGAASAITVYINAVSRATGTNSNNLTKTSGSIGKTWDNYYFNGYISGARLVIGSANAPSGVPIAPPTAITNTSLLLNFTNAGIVDSTAKNVLETVGNAQISTTQSKFGGSSLYFDGTGDYLQIPDSNLFISGTENFTVEMWVYLTASGTMYIAGQCDSGGSLGSQSIAILKTSTEKLQFYGVSGTTQYICTSSANLSLNTWTHIACVRNGSTLTQYINGVADGTASISTASINNSSNKFGVGTLGELTSSTVNGYIDDFRITKGYARYTANFTVQTSQWQDQ